MGSGERQGWGLPGGALDYVLSLYPQMEMWTPEQVRLNQHPSGLPPASS